MPSGQSHENKVLIASAEEYFRDLVKEGFVQRKIKTAAHIQNYIASLLYYYMDAKNLFEENSIDGMAESKTLAEQLMLASQKEVPVKNNLLKKLGDRSLYISGFFGDSLQRKLIDVDYYAQIGQTAYSTLAHHTQEDTHARIYQIIASKFIELMDVLTYISQKATVNTNQGILRLYDRYMRTGSSLAKDKLIEMGVLNFAEDQIKLSKQS